jgi:hypothetical protein
VADCGSGCENGAAEATTPTDKTARMLMIVRIGLSSVEPSYAQGNVGKQNWLTDVAD